MGEENVNGVGAISAHPVCMQCSARFKQPDETVF